MDASIAAIVLAAGKGTRMKSPPTKNKVTYTLKDKPMIWYTKQMLRQAGLGQLIVVIGYAGESVKAALGNDVTYAVQENPQGTGHAVKVALPYLPEPATTIVTMYGDDSAFYPPGLIRTLIRDHQSQAADVTVVTIHKEDPVGLGRIIRNGDGNITAIIEEKNATPEQKRITEINTGLYCFKRVFLEKAVASLNRNPISGEFYLTDVIEYANTHGNRITGLIWPDDSIWLGVNTPEQLKEAELRMNARSNVQ